MELLDPQGRRLYLTADERAAFLETAAKAPRNVRSLCLVLHYTGCRLSEALALTLRRVDLSGKVIVFETLKKRRRCVFRAVPVPESVLDNLDMIHGLREAMGRLQGQDVPLWSWSRVHGWRVVRKVMQEAGITEGPHASPKGLRHGYGIAAISAGVPLNMLRKWMGHASIETTAIYANAVGEEEQSIAERMWG